MKIKLLDKNAKIPFRANKTDAGADLHSIESLIINPLERACISTGVSVEIPEGYYGRIAPRSGLAHKNGIDVMAGIIDSSYRGELKVILFNTDKEKSFEINKGDRIAQLIIEDHFNFDFEVVDELVDTERGENGFGSTGV